MQTRTGVVAGPVVPVIMAALLQSAAAATADPFGSAITTLTAPADQVVTLVKLGGVFAMIACGVAMMWMRGKFNWLWWVGILGGLLVAGRADLFVRLFWGNGSPITAITGS